LLLSTDFCSHAPDIDSKIMMLFHNSSRLAIAIRGAVQGVGFRPFIYRLANEIGLLGWVNNSTEGVFIEIEGTPEQLESFLLRLKIEKPLRSQIQSIETSKLEPIGYKTFEIRASTKGQAFPALKKQGFLKDTASHMRLTAEGGQKTAVILPDLATCSDCLKEIFDSTNRRYYYPFTNCTNCGPRYTIIEALPYDRQHTTMKTFQMCTGCETEYKNPLDRRFHAQPNACTQCGPHVELWDDTGKVLNKDRAAISATAITIRQGKIVAVKGLGGFHLIVDARNKQAIKLLRQRKHRPDKPFALMYPSLQLIKEHCQVSALEERLLQSSQAPIVLLKRKEKDNCDCLIAPGNPYLGIMLPSTPIHHLLMAELGFPVIATSGNLKHEPICIDEREAIVRLKGVADLFLVHDRPIVRPVDDSIARIIMGEETILRRARGYAPLPILNRQFKQSIPEILAVGAHLKNAIALAIGDQIFLSQHIGELQTPQAIEAFETVITSFQQLYDFQPKIIACDLHPDYFSSQYAQNSGLKVISVQHHHAHVLACMAENQLLGETVLGVAWDGTGYGLDGTIWGSEFLLVSPNGRDGFQRIAHLRPFPLPGSDRAAQEPRRVAIGLLYELFGARLFAEKQFQTWLRAFSEAELAILSKILLNRINAPLTSSMGRLFDGIAAISNLCQIATFEGQAAMQLEFVIDQLSTNQVYPLLLQTNQIDWRPMLLAILDDLSRGVTVNLISAKFHNTLIDAIVKIVQKIEVKKIVLTGGCFQNKYLTEKAIDQLRAAGFCPYWHKFVPPNDGGIALGQAIAASREISHTNN
jgi:hydrogenase maturation protein HypF